MYEDKILKCRDCGEEFVFSASEQQFYADKGFQHEPSRCRACRQKNKDKTRQMYDIVCANCGKPAKVSFKPTGERPVLCSECYAASRNRY